MIRGAYTPSFRIKQHPLEDAGIYHILPTNYLPMIVVHLHIMQYYDMYIYYIIYIHIIYMYILVSF